MRFLLFLTMLLATRTVTVAQTPYQAMITQQFVDYSQLIIDRKFEAAMDYTHEGVFTLLPRAKMVDMMESVFKDPGMEYQLTLPTLRDFSRDTTVAGVRYVKFTSHAPLRIKMMDVANTPVGQERDETVALYKGVFAMTFGNDNVTYDPATLFFTVQTAKLVIAKSNDGQRWRFAVVDNENRKALMRQFIPAFLLE